jgi:hypothetical protein
LDLHGHPLWDLEVVPLKIEKKEKLIQAFDDYFKKSKNYQSFGENNFVHFMQIIPDFLPMDCY